MTRSKIILPFLIKEFNDMMVHSSYDLWRNGAFQQEKFSKKRPDSTIHDRKIQYRILVILKIIQNTTV